MEPVNTNFAAHAVRWRQVWTLVAAAAVGVPVWLGTGVLMHAQQGETGLWFRVGDPLTALCCLVALRWRRRFPRAVPTVVALAASASTAALGAALLAVASVATRRRTAETVPVVLAFVVGAQASVALYPLGTPEGGWWLTVGLVTHVLAAGVAVATGVAVGARRSETRSLRERAESVEREQRALAAEAEARERNRIAREMHDVLAHRISLIAVQAGVLDHRTDLPAEDSRVLIRGIVDGSRQALEELRDVLGALRADPERREVRQASFEGVGELVAGARSAGLDVTFGSSVSGTPPEDAGRTCYRVVQEGLTNAAKHAPGARIDVTVEGEAGGTLSVRVHNSPADGAGRDAGPGAGQGVGPAVPAPESGFGLRGLAERVSLAGGRLDHHATPTGGHLLTARLPWPRRPGSE
ncbi:sensor histidine kinase [Streptomyces sp. Z26]|nr:sensor histidine kinase [Streptomyces sp. Z26]